MNITTLSIMAARADRHKLMCFIFLMDIVCLNVRAKTSRVATIGIAERYLQKINLTNCFVRRAPLEIYFPKNHTAQFYQCAMH